LDWARHQLGIERIGVRVRSDNRALNFYLKFGFREIQRVPLRRKVTHDLVEWLEDPGLVSAQNLSLVHMELTG
ncbi:MAG TPA: GNAT family N-acetyltransferase, partial [Rhodocyclaceae bacterium]|nr:GNAT family N-acetyltransferase [Rhodocyclaceae bacterium]